MSGPDRFGTGMACAGWSLWLQPRHRRRRWWQQDRLRLPGGWLELAVRWAGSPAVDHWRRLDGPGVATRETSVQLRSHLPSSGVAMPGSTPVPGWSLCSPQPPPAVVSHSDIGGIPAGCDARVGWWWAGRHLHALEVLFEDADLQSGPSRRRCRRRRIRVLRRISGGWTGGGLRAEARRRWTRHGIRSLIHSWRPMWLLVWGLCRCPWSGRL